MQTLQNAITDIRLPRSGPASLSGEAISPKEEALAVEVVSSVAGLRALEGDWVRLEALCGAAIVFQSFSHIQIWARHFLGSSTQRLHIAVVRESGRAVLILPLVISGRAPLRIARIAGDPIAQYADLLLDPDTDEDAAFGAALKSLVAAGADAIVLRRVREDSHLVRLAAGHLRPPTNPTVAPFADLSSCADYDAFLRTRSKNMRRSLRNRQHHLDKAGDVAFELLTGEAAREALADAIDLKRKWLIQRGAISSAFLETATRDCLLDFAADATGSGAMVMRLTVRGEPAAIRFGFEYQGTHFAYLSAFDENFADLSPGKMLMSFYLAQFRARGIDCVDMLPPLGRHKTDWCSSETRVADYTLPLTRVGRAYAGLFQERLRPGLRRTWYAIPDGVRSLAAALFVTI